MTSKPIHDRGRIALAISLCVAVLASSAHHAFAAEATPPPAAPPSSQPASPPSSPSAQQPSAASPYTSLAHMVVEANYGGPLSDTLIQRLRDPVDGTICYLYLPIAVPHGLPEQDGIVRYGTNSIGSISCFPAQGGVPRKK